MASFPYTGRKFSRFLGRLVANGVALVHVMQIRLGATPSWAREASFVSSISSLPPPNRTPAARCKVEREEAWQVQSSMCCHSSTLWPSGS